MTTASLSRRLFSSHELRRAIVSDPRPSPQHRSACRLPPFCTSIASPWMTCRSICMRIRSLRFSVRMDRAKRRCSTIWSACIGQPRAEFSSISWRLKNSCNSTPLPKGLERSLPKYYSWSISRHREIAFAVRCLEEWNGGCPCRALSLEIRRSSCWIR